MTAVQGVTITPELPGIVSEIAFESGAVVAKGDLLVRLDTSPEEAQLRALEAQEELARLNVDRERTLRSQNMVSQSELDTAEATLKQNQANADTIRATIEKKTIRAPFAGRLGIRLVNLGQYLDAGKPIVSLQSLSPIYADFSLPQQELARLKTGMRGAPHDRRLSRAGTFEGKLTAINPDLDAVHAQCGLAGDLRRTRSNCCAPACSPASKCCCPKNRTCWSIPATAVLSAPYGDSVYVIESKPGTNGAAKPGLVRAAAVRPHRARARRLRERRSRASSRATALSARASSSCATACP